MPRRRPPSPQHFQLCSDDCIDDSDSSRVNLAESLETNSQNSNIHEHQDPFTPHHNSHFYSHVRLPLNPSKTDMVNTLHYAGMPFKLLGFGADKLEQMLNSREGNCPNFTFLSKGQYNFRISMTEDRIITVTKEVIPQKFTPNQRLVISDIDKFFCFVFILFSSILENIIIQTTNQKRRKRFPNWILLKKNIMNGEMSSNLLTLFNWINNNIILDCLYG